MGLFEKESDVERGKSHDSVATTDIGVGYVTSDNAITAAAFTSGNSIYAKAQRIAGKLGVEQRGIERVPEAEKTDTSMSHAGTLWLSANLAVTTFAVGVLAIPLFNLNFVSSALVIIFMNTLGILPVCFFSTFGPKFGLRQIVLSRFYFGYQGTKLSWSSVNVIVGTQLLHAINPNLPGWAGIVVIAVSTLLVCIFGYRIIHVYERFAWIPVFIIFLVVLGVFVHSGDFDGGAGAMASDGDNTTATSKKEKAGAVLSFATAVFGSATGWCSLAADYTVYLRADTPGWPVFLWTFAGLILPLCFAQLLGAAVATATVANASYRDAYDGAGVGGLLARVLVPALGGFGQFCLVILALSVIAGNCPNLYSGSMSLQVLTPEKTAAAATITTGTGAGTVRTGIHSVPRFVWVFVSTVVYVAISIPGYDHFEAALENFMLLIGYWLAAYEGVALTEHVVFRRCSMDPVVGYRPEGYDDPAWLPPGFAAIAAFLCGVVGAILGMAQTWYVGPIGRLCGGELGGDVGFELAFFFTVASYLPLRTWEKKRFGR
ncbi:Purine-cytosine permease fcy21 [Diatrype stigma]|uniref:Purine-cytosine permease fcy21 n=1 Tax=Diatrype stigma TaxID=117547 RepID=A0AAN9UW02_9PEZI